MADNSNKALLDAATNAAAMIGALYEFADRANAVGGATTISGVAACNTMLQSMKKNRKRVNDTILQPLIDAIERAKAGVQ